MVCRRQGGWWDGSGPAAGKTALHGVGVCVGVQVSVFDVPQSPVVRRASQALGLRPLLSQTRSEALAWLPNGFPIFYYSCCLLAPSVFRRGHQHLVHLLA